MQQFVYEIRISADTTDEPWLAALRHELEFHGGKGLGGIGRMRTVKQAHQYAVFLTMLDVAKNEAAIRAFDGMRIEGVRIRCHAEHYAFFSGVPEYPTETSPRPKQDDEYGVMSADLMRNQRSRGGASFSEGGRM